MSLVLTGLSSATSTRRARLLARGWWGAARPLTSRPGAKGAVKVKRLPWPGVDSTRMSPPMRLASSRLMARPRPVPPNLRELAVLAWRKLSKMTSSISGGMPMPVSDTSKLKRGSPPDG